MNRETLIKKIGDSPFLKVKYFLDQVGSFIFNTSSEKEKRYDDAITPASESLKVDENFIEKLPFKKICSAQYGLMNSVDHLISNNLQETCNAIVLEEHINSHMSVRFLRNNFEQFFRISGLRSRSYIESFKEAESNLNLYLGQPSIKFAPIYAFSFSLYVLNWKGFIESLYSEINFTKEILPLLKNSKTFYSLIKSHTSEEEYDQFKLLMELKQ